MESRSCLFLSMTWDKLFTFLDEWFLFRFFFGGIWIKPDTCNSSRVSFNYCTTLQTNVLVVAAKQRNIESTVHYNKHVKNIRPWFRPWRDVGWKIENIRSVVGSELGYLSIPTRVQNCLTFIWFVPSRYEIQTLSPHRLDLLVSGDNTGLYYTSSVPQKTLP